jgi:hypothetical protein
MNRGRLIKDNDGGDENSYEYLRSFIIIIMYLE